LRGTRRQPRGALDSSPPHPFPPCGTRKMAFTLPNFNLELLVWRSTFLPSEDEPNETAWQCQLYIQNKLQTLNWVNEPGVYTPPIIIRAPLAFQPRTGDIYGVGGNTHTYYNHRWSHIIHWGFPNAYRAILTELCGPARQMPWYHQEELG